MPQETVLITGANGFIGSALLLGALDAGYRANIILRSDAKVEVVRDLVANRSSVNGSEQASRCKFFVVPDLTIPGSMDEAAVGADYVFHCATPLSFGDLPAAERQQAEIVDPAIRCAVGMLESAKKAETVRRVVMIASMAAFASMKLLSPGVPNETETVLSEASLNDYLHPPFPHPFVGYGASKTAALRKSMEWMIVETKTKSVSFDLINIAPSFVLGHHPLANSVKDLFGGCSNGMLLRVVAGNGEIGPQPESVGCGCALSDVVDLSLKSLDTKTVQTSTEGSTPGVENFCAGVDLVWEDAKPLAAARWPAEVSEGLLPNKGDYPTKGKVKLDTSKAQRAFGLTFKGLDGMLEETVPQYLELARKQTTTSK